MDHKGEDPHLRCTAVVELDGALVVLLGLGPSSSIHTSLASSLNISLSVVGECKINGPDEDDQLAKTLLREGVGADKTGNSIVDITELGSEGNLSREVHARGSGQVTKDGKHGNTAVLGLDVAKTIEALLVGISQQVKRIPEAKRRLSTNLRLEASSSRRVGHAANRGESSVHQRK